MLSTKDLSCFSTATATENTVTSGFYNSLSKKLVFVPVANIMTAAHRNGLILGLASKAR